MSLQQPNQGHDPTSSPTFWGLQAKAGTGLTDVAKVTSAGALTSIVGNLSAGTHTTGNYAITNPAGSADLATCAIVVTPNSGGDNRATASATGAHTITVLTFNNLGQAADAAFSLMVTCP